MATETAEEKRNSLYYKTLDFLRGRKRAYQVAFSGPAGERVLEDLAKFCRANEPTFASDDRNTARYEGRREVWLRVTAHLGLTSEQLFKYFNTP